MIRIKFIQPIELFSGRIGLSDKQAQVRRSWLKAIGKDLYEITGPIQFKAGEAIGLETVDPYLRTVLTPDSAASVAAMDRAEIEAEAAAAKAQSESETETGQKTKVKPKRKRKNGRGRLIP